MSMRTPVILAGLAAVLAALLAATPAAAASCSDPSGVCLGDAKGAKFEPDASMSAKAMKAKRKGPSCKVSFEIDGGRGSVFVDGRYAGTAPLQGFSMLPGKHDIQVRDGQEILAEGVLTVPKGGTIQVTVKHD
jgi:hypothetical protein